MPVQRSGQFAEQLARAAARAARAAAAAAGRTPVPAAEPAVEPDTAPVVPAFVVAAADARKRHWHWHWHRRRAAGRMLAAAFRAPSHLKLCDTKEGVAKIRPSKQGKMEADGRAETAFEALL